jgi:peptidoglycan hydrolase-like protein with peptidoglycan-binding domain
MAQESPRRVSGFVPVRTPFENRGLVQEPLTLRAQYSNIIDLLLRVISVFQSIAVDALRNDSRWSMRALLATGAIGEIVRQAQTKLAQAALYSGSCDGWFGEETAKAVDQFQQAQSLPATGSIDETSWASLMQAPVPPASVRSLQLTASFENHGFGVAVGNFDGAFLTWGIIGFTLASGKISALVLKLNQTDPQKIQQAFGAYTGELLDLMADPKEKQKSWADNHTLSNGQLAEPWKSMFADFGSYPEVQIRQMELVRWDYLLPAITLCRCLNFTSELGLALCFDTQVQNGGIKPAAMKVIATQMQGRTDEGDVLGIVANTVADSATARWKEDVRRRKLAIATDSGTVHGHLYVLEDWGLSADYAAAEIMAG